MNKFDQELIDAIADESNKFDMERYCVTGTETDAPSCGTALCMAGHICGTLRPNLAAALLSAFPNHFRGWSNGPVNYQQLAKFIYNAETGERCRLVFMADEHTTKSSSDKMSSITRADVIAHIRGRSKRWPLLPNYF